MTTAADREAARLDAAYAAERARLILGRVRWAAGLALLPIGVSAVVNGFVFPDRLGERLAAHAVQAAVCLAAVLLTRAAALAPKAIALALALVLGMDTSLFWALSLSPRDLDVLVGVIVSTMVGSTLLFPWGVGPQALASTFLGAGYLLLPPLGAMGEARIANVLIGLVLGASTSVIGAWVLDRQRRATFIERERVAALARQGELLVEAGRELNGTLELAALYDRIVHQARRLVGADAAGLALVDERRAVIVQVAVATDRPEHDRQLVGLEYALREEPFLGALRRDGLLDLPNGSPADVAHEIARRAGYARTFYVAIQRGGRLLGLLACARRDAAALDVHERRLAEALAHQAAIALANARLVEDLQTASRVKSDFVSTMSHELRTPLNVILGFAEMARDAAVATPEREDCLGRIDAAGRDLLGLIESTLEIGKIEAGRDDAQLAPVSLPELWAGWRAACERLPRHGDVRLEWDEPAPEVSIVTDPRKLTVVMRNLVGNALKFTERGRVLAEATVDGGALVLRVSDTGIGIRPEDQSSIFEMFRQADGSSTRRYGGTGLGLYIVRRFVQQLGGTIALESAPGRGSVFTVRLPAPGASIRAAA